MIELLVTLFLFGSGVASDEASANIKTHSVDRADCVAKFDGGEIDLRQGAAGLKSGCPFDYDAAFGRCHDRETSDSIYLGGCQRVLKRGLTPDP